MLTPDLFQRYCERLKRGINGAFRPLDVETDHELYEGGDFSLKIIRRKNSKNGVWYPIIYELTTADYCLSVEYAPGEWVWSRHFTNLSDVEKVKIALQVSCHDT